MNEAESLPPCAACVDEEDWREVQQKTQGNAFMVTDGGPGGVPLFTADQMREYARQAVAAERDRLADKWATYHGFDKYGVAGFIRETK